MADTIYALATGIGKAGVAVVRASGPHAAEAAVALTGRDLPAPRSLVRRGLIDPETRDRLDDGLLAWFPAPGSYSGEDIVEFHIHGGAACVDAVLSALGGCRGLRLAEPGEFTKRAFANGKMDLTEVEGLADLIDAETAAQRRQALRQAQGGLRAVYDAWTEALTAILAHCEAVIDFPDEDLPEEIQSRNDSQISRLTAEISQHLDTGSQGERLRRGVQIAIVGAPNVGKSSLLNRLAGRDAAIVSDRAGTTRDVVAVQMDLDGYPAMLIDTAGIQETEDDIEREGIRRARLAEQDADVVVSVTAGGTSHPVSEGSDKSVLLVWNKSDLHPEECGDQAKARTGYFLSARTGQGIDAFVIALTEAVRQIADLTETPVLTRARHREALSFTLTALERARQLEDPILVAEEVREAVRWMGRLTGRVDVEALLDVIFRDFCIGK